MTIATATPPQFSNKEALSFVQQFYGLEVKSINPLGSYIDQNFLVTDQQGREYTLKIHDGAEQESVLDFQDRAMIHLGTHLSEVVFPLPSLTVSGESRVLVKGVRGANHFVRLLSFVPGRLLKELGEFSDELLKHIGLVLGRMDQCLQDFCHPAANRADIPWDLKNASQVRHLCRNIEDHHRRRIAEYFFLAYETEVKPELLKLRQSVVHNDSHRYSLLVGTDQNRLSGVIDFGDMVLTQTISNLAICLSDVMVQCENPIIAAGKIVAAYHQQFRLQEQEVDLLYHLVCTRLSVYGCMSATAAKSKPENSHAQLKTEEVWNLLEKLLATNPVFAEDHFRSVCGMRSNKADRIKQGRKIQEQRTKLFPRSLYTHYQNPLTLQRGALQYLYDDSGNTYLDCVNNVCQWGHCNPRIVRAGQNQMARLNTNSRYLHSAMTDYAERLVETFPEPLQVCFLVNSGSEANDLAMRLARSYTKNEEVIVIDKAYHGNSSVCTDISPNRIDRDGGPGLPSYVHSSLIPDTFRGKYKNNDANAGSLYAEDIARITAELKQDGKGVAAFYAESLIGTGGQIVLPPNYLREAYQHVRDAGGVCIADEVQVGLGRTGDQVWCFEAHQVVPDIVTVGKPIGNGHPLAAVVTTQAIAAAFDDEGITYFNTFGGNPVSCSIASAVLDVLEQDELLENCRQMSKLLVNGLYKLQQQFPVIADIRGQGLYIGIELMSEESVPTPAARFAQKLVEACKARGVLLNSNGYDNNIIKIKPPLIISKKDVNQLLSTLGSALVQVQSEGLVG